jgi:uncharacterized RDD family membrane protein YckC
MTLPDETLNIQTPENVTFGYDIAGIGTRFLSALIDTVLITVLQVIVSLLLVLILRLSNAISADSGTGLPDLGAWVIAALGLVSFLFLWGYYIFFELLWNGATPGKRALGLRVIRVDGTPITITESVIRNLVRLVDFLPAYYGIGVIVIFVNRQTRRLGDLAAGTVVVREAGLAAQKKKLADLEKALVQPQARPAVDPVPLLDPADAVATPYPVERLAYADVQIIESFFVRRKELTNPGPLAAQLAARLWAKMQLDSATLPNGPAAETALETILTEYRARNSQ